MTDREAREAIVRKIGEYRADWQQFLRELVAIETPTRCAENIRLAAAKIADRIKALWGCEAELPDAEDFGCHVLARAGSTAPDARKVLVIGHFDTVHPLGTLEEVGMQEHDGRMYGPGIYDMKTGVASMVYAVAALKELDLLKNRQIVCLFNCDEERGSARSKPYILRLAEECDIALIAEPSTPEGDALKSSRSGICPHKVRVYGRASHAGSAPEKGVNAINELARQLLKIADMNDYARGISLNCGVIRGGTVTNVVPDYAEASIDVRVRTLADREEIHRKLLGLTAVDPGARVEVTGHFGRPPMEDNEGTRAMLAKAREIWSDFGFAEPLNASHSGGGSDGNYTSMHIPTLDGLGAVGDGGHTKEEWIDVEKSVQRMMLLAGLMAEA